MNKKGASFFNLKDICEIAIFCSFAILLDTFVKIPIFINGGSINIAVIPLIFITLHKGWIKGFISSAIIFGIVTCLLDGYGIHTYPLDYFFGYGSVAIIGLFRNYIIPNEKAKFKNYLIFTVTILLSFLIRLIASTISGIVFYGLNFIGSLVYQLTYLVPSYIAVLVISLALLNFYKTTFSRLS